MGSDGHDQGRPSEPAAPRGGPLARRLGTTDAVVIGLGSMIGAGVFSAFGPAAAAAGAGLLIGLVVAAGVAFCNATSSAQLAARYPTSGGTYVYGRERLGEWWGFTAGWGFVVGKTASCAAMALTVAAYAIPGPVWAQRLVAVGGVLGLAALNLRGVTKTAATTRVLVALSLTALAVAVGGLIAGLIDDAQRAAPSLDMWGGPYGVLQAAGLLFFAFAGYARIATMGEEVREPQRTIPRAITIALAITVVIYVAVAVTILLAAGPATIAASTAPLVDALRAVDLEALAPVVRVGAVVSALGALLALMAGVGRTMLAMARQRDLPAWLDAVDQDRSVPHHAEIALAALVCLLVLTTDLRGVIGFSSFGVLVYYAIANLAAYTQPAAERRWPRAVQIAGVAGCLVLVATLPWQAVVAGVIMFAVGLGGRLAKQRSSRR